jgi:hypothetical protein
MTPMVCTVLMIVHFSDRLGLGPGLDERLGA